MSGSGRQGPVPPTRVINSRSDAYAYITTGSTVFDVVDAVTLLLFEAEVRETLKTKRFNKGQPYAIATAAEIDALIKTDYSVDDLNKFQRDAFKLLEEHTSAAHRAFSLRENKFLFIPKSIWYGAFGNCLFVVIILFVVLLNGAFKWFSQIDLLKIVLSWFDVSWP